MGMLKSFFDLTAMDDAVDEMVTALDTLTPDEFHEKILGLSVPARYLAKQVILADLHSDPGHKRADKLQQVLDALELVN